MLRKEWLANVREENRLIWSRFLLFEEEDNTSILTASFLFDV